MRRQLIASLTLTTLMAVTACGSDDSHVQAIAPAGHELSEGDGEQCNDPCYMDSSSAERSGIGDALGFTAQAASARATELADLQGRQLALDGLRELSCSRFGALQTGAPKISGPRYLPGTLSCATGQGGQEWVDACKAEVAAANAAGLQLDPEQMCEGNAPGLGPLSYWATCIADFRAWNILECACVQDRMDEFGYMIEERCVHRW